MYGTSVFRLVRTSSVRNYKNDSTKKLLEFLADMPKANTKRIVEAQQQRHTISKKGEKYGPSTVYLQVLGSGARGAPNTLYLFTDQKRYLFNCGECTQRLAHEHKVKLSRLEHIFITTKTWKNIGGLPGLSLTLQDVGVPRITLHGPEGLDELYNATKRFVIMKDMEVKMAPTNPDPANPAEDFQDSVMTVKYVILKPQLSLLQEMPPKPCKRARLGEVTSPVYDQFTHDDTDYYMRGSSPEPPDPKKPKPRLPRSPGSEYKKKSDKVANDLKPKKQCSVAYICTLKKRLGTLDLAKCVEKGVPPGPLLGQLKTGLDVVLSDGTLVLSKDVKTPDDPGPVFIDGRGGAALNQLETVMDVVVYKDEKTSDDLDLVFIVLELPDISYLNEAEFSAYFDNGTNPQENIPTLIVHLSPPEVFHHNSYKAFMAKFGETTRHLLINSQNSCLGSEAVHRTQHKLHLLDPEVFPLLKDPSVPAEWSTHPPIPKSNSPVKLKGFEDLKNRIAMAQFQNIINAESNKGDAMPEEPESPKLETYSSRTLTMFHLRPKRQIDRSAEPKLHIQDYYQETMDVDGFVASLEKFRALVHDARYAKNPSMKEYPKIVFLGTGSCIPSKTRNTSGIMVHIDDQSTILLDCGEGTFGQLVRFYGPRRVDELLRTLKAVYISHLHADHHIGLIGVLQARAAAFSDAPGKSAPVLLLAPGQIVTWLTMYDQQFERICGEFSLIPNQNLLESAKEQGTWEPALAGAGLEAVRTCLVPHCPNAFGVALTIAGHKVTYSGDTLPSQNLVKIGENSTILIHEATMEDELAEEARVKMHSTTSQAIEIGRNMNAKYTVLTHFSQRYARLPRLNAHILNDNDTVGIAFDNMQITLSDLPLLPHMYAPLQLMFADHCVDMELKAATRERRRERRASSTSLASGDELKRRRSARARSRGSKSSSTTRSLTCDSNSSRDEHLKIYPNRRDYVKKSAITVQRVTHQPLKKNDDPNKDKYLNVHTKKSTTITSMHETRQTRRESHDTKRNETLNKELRPIPPACALRYRETHSSRLRRESMSSNSNSVSRSRISPSPSCRRTTTNTPMESRCPTPRLASPPPEPATPSPAPLGAAPAAPHQGEHSTPRTLSNTELSKHAQEFLWAVSNPPSCSLVTSRTKTIAYDVKMTDDELEDPKRNRSNLSKTYMLAHCKNGYGKPLVKSTKKVLTIRKNPTSTTPSASDVSSVGASPRSTILRPCIGNATPNAHRERGGSDAGAVRFKGAQAAQRPIFSFARVTADVGASRNESLRSRSPMRGDPAKKQPRSSNASVKFSNIPVPTQKVTANVTAARPQPLAHNAFNMRPAKPPPLIESDLKTASRTAVPRKIINTSYSVACNSKASTNGGFSPTKSFIPQLEDIKSSYLLLKEKTEQQQNIKIKNQSIKSDESRTFTRQRTWTDDNKKRRGSIDKVQTSSLKSSNDENQVPQKPEPVNENVRKIMLQDIKMKYQSKLYRCQSRYERIEGLNWISWSQ